MVKICNMIKIDNLPPHIVEAIREYVRFRDAFRDGKIGGCKELALHTLAAYIGEQVIANIDAL